MKKQLYLAGLLGMVLAACQPASSSLVSSTSPSLTSAPTTTSYVDTTSTEVSVSSSSVDSEIASSTEISTTSSEDASSISESSETLSSSQPGYDYSGYYESLNGLADDQLMQALRPLLRQVLGSDGLFPSTNTYQTAITTLQDADQDPSNPNNIIVWYRMTSVSKTWDSGGTWNREHVWPQSLLNVSTSNSSRHKGADAHNLKPANPSDNSSRGNKYFAEATTSTSFDPPDSIRGDIARILFYMVTMYPELSLVDVVSGSPAIYQMAQFSLMVKWHILDPVDVFESNRNEIIYERQGNRNPFIDHEELVCRMFRLQSVAATNACQA